MRRRAVHALLTALAVAHAAGPARALERLRYQEYPHLEGRPVSRVVVLGNNRTREVVFRREMRLEEGVPFRAEDLWRDWERVVDLGLFAEVEVDAVPSGDGVLVVISVYERPTWFVAPVADYDLDEKRITLGYRARLRNISGMNRQLRSSGRAGDKDRFSVSWETPWIGSRRQSLFVDLRVELPQEDEDELRSNSVTIASTRFLGDYRVTRQGLTGFARLEALDRDGTHPEGLVDEISPFVGAGYFRDKRNVRIDPSRGTLASASAEYVWGIRTNDVSYVRSGLDGRSFLAVGRGMVLATRLATVLTTGEVPTYRKLGVGGASSIRGQPGDVERGNNVARASVELRFPIMEKTRFSIPIPLVPKSVSNFDLRIDGEIFVDSGTAWDDSVGLRSARVRSGAGVGLRVFLPIVELARFEVAFDESGGVTFYLREGNVI